MLFYTHLLFYFARNFYSNFQHFLGFKPCDVMSETFIVCFHVKTQIVQLQDPLMSTIKVDEVKRETIEDSGTIPMETNHHGKDFEDDENVQKRRSSMFMKAANLRSGY